MIQETGQESRLVRALRIILAVGIVATSIVGVIVLGRWLIAAVQSLHFGFLSPIAGWIYDYVLLHPDGWTTAIATAILAWFTYALTRSTQAQSAGDAPLLHYRLYMDDQALPGSNPDYWESYRLLDSLIPELAKFIESSTRYVRINVTNEQSKPYGVALEANLVIRLSWGALDNKAQHPYFLDRLVTSAAIGAGKAIEGRILNVGSLPNFTVQVISLSYRTIAGRSRALGYGTGSLYQRIGETAPVATDTVFKPTKREMLR